MKKIVVAADSFKGCLSSSQVAAAVSSGILEVFHDCEIVRIEAADGGEGTCAALTGALGGRMVEAVVHDPLMRPLRAVYGISADGRTAVMETATASGLALLGPLERNPMKTTTYGTGEMISDALARGCRRFLIGLGGTATNDAGTGMLSVLGVKFMDFNGRPLPGTGESLAQVADIDMGEMRPELKEAEFTAACDVENPFCGPDGAAFIYGPQKGADARMAEALDSGMRNFAAATMRALGTDIRKVRGAGAAGGMGAALLAFLHADLVPGAEMVLDASDFDRKAAGADLVITGEGRIDAQTSMGKLPLRVLRRASALGIPVIALAGDISPDAANPGFAGMFRISPPGCPRETAMRPEVAEANIRRTLAAILRGI